MARHTRAELLYGTRQAPHKCQFLSGFFSRRVTGVSDTDEVESLMTPLNLCLLSQTSLLSEAQVQANNLSVAHSLSPTLCV